MRISLFSPPFSSAHGNALAWSAHHPPHLHNPRSAHTAAGKLTNLDPSPSDREGKEGEKGKETGQSYISHHLWEPWGSLCVACDVCLPVLKALWAGIQSLFPVHLTQHAPSKEQHKFQMASCLQRDFHGLSVYWNAKWAAALTPTRGVPDSRQEKTQSNPTWNANAIKAATLCICSSNAHFKNASNK